MLRLSTAILAGVAAAALFTGSAALGQLSGKLDAQEQKLAQAEKSCGEVNLAEYARLLQEAQQNRQRADKAKKKGVPVDEAQVNADLAKAMSLFARAHAAQARNCVMQARQQPAQPQPKTTGALPGRPPERATTGGATCGPARFEPADFTPRIPTEEDINRYGEQAEEAVKESRYGDAEVILGALESDAAQLRQTIEDAKQAGEASKIDVGYAEKRLKQIEAWLKWGERHGVKPCRPFDPGRPKQTSMNLSGFGREVLAAHNVIRSRFHVPPMQWRSDLEQGATARAQAMAAAHDLTHAPREGRGTIRENILKAPRSYSATQMINLWGREVEDFVPGTFPNVCRSGGECTGVYHLSQIAWPTTFFVGCGEASDAIYTYVSCWYDKGGNKDGKQVGTRAAGDTGYDSWVREHPITEDYGSDGALFVGYDLGAFRLEAEVAYKRAGIDDIQTNVALPGNDRRVDSSDGMIGRTAPLFDIGIYAGGAWSSDWFNHTPAPVTLEAMVNRLLDFGDDDGISGFVGGGVGMARMNHNNVRIFANLPPFVDDSDVSLAWKVLCTPPYVETKVEAPNLDGKPEIFGKGTGMGGTQLSPDSLIFLPQDGLSDCVM
jgi:hypothetical protein